jgi:hypothetical protein
VKTSNHWNSPPRIFPSIGNVRTIAAVILFPVFSSFSQQTDADNAPRTNAAERALIMRGLYEGRSRSATNAPIPTTAKAVEAALQAFKTSQNPDGSWGDEGNKTLSTALVLTAFLNRGETEGSREFGGHISKASAWLLESNASNNEERIALVVALSEQALMQIRTGSTNIPARTTARIQSLVSEIKPRKDDPWTTLLIRHRLPPDIERPEWAQYTRETAKEWASTEVSFEPSTVEAYLNLFLVGLAKFNQGENRWSDFNRAFAPKIIERQLPTGFYPCTPNSDKFACTALALRTMAIYYAFAPPFWTSPRQWTPTDGNQDVRVNVQ